LEETDASDAGGSGIEAEASVVGGDPSQGEDGRLAGAGTGDAQSIDAERRRDSSVGWSGGFGAVGNGDGFAEDGAEED